MRKNFGWIIAGVAATALLFALFGMREAGAHDAQSGMTYEGTCCNGNAINGDCHHIPASAVLAIADGYQITLNPGDHPLVTKTQIFIRLFPEVRYTPSDGAYHACLFPTENTLRCFYAPPAGM